ncbi:glycoside hydrolase family 16 protein [Dictyobacter kobayashii]|uniref:GH16 domain-containing protein n=1 Tax=Dictyobacter kobayashii TaxID=2014872 RepID=A0A402AUB2_9CHLR|nr:glycoside hydrolase family 16 protein [Dictyobacter kobayashii]GCE22623.1 hypothetical protein KDK_64230 [Dictyobacter kobayashii]
MKQKQRLLLVGGLIVLCVLIVATVFIYPAFSHSTQKVTPIPATQATSGASSQQAGNRTTKDVNIQLIPHKSVAPPTPVPAAKPTTLPPTASANTGVTSDNASWTLILNDDFNGTTLNAPWGTYNGPHGGGKSYYSPAEVQVSNGFLHVNAERKNTNGYAITTGGLAAFSLAQIYGKYEIRVRLPYGKGLDPYTILWPNTQQPNAAQVDLFESPPVNKDTLYCTNHGVDGTFDQVQAHGSFADGFHVLTYEWTPGRIRFLVDGIDQGSLTKDIPNFPMWFGIAISSGDAFTGDPDPTTVFPVSMDVDWVHIYKYNG